MPRRTRKRTAGKCLGSLLCLLFADCFISHPSPLRDPHLHFSVWSPERFLQPREIGFWLLSLPSLKSHLRDTTKTYANTFRSGDRQAAEKQNIQVCDLLV